MVRERRKRSGSGVLEGEGEGEVVTVGLAEVSEVLDGVAERAANTQQVTPGGRAHTHTRAQLRRGVIPIALCMAATELARTRC